MPADDDDVFTGEFPFDAVSFDDAEIGPDVAAESAAGLAAGLSGLAGIEAGHTTLAELLTDVSSFALRAIPGADGVGVTMIESTAPDTIVASSPFVQEIDDIQYRLGEGPCISAAAQARTTGSAELGIDESWPRFGPMAAALGIHSALSLPLILHELVIGALNVYSFAHDAFTDEARRIGELFAGPAAVAVYNARVLDQALKDRARLELALTSRSVIDQAIGIIQARSGISADEAFVRLRIISQHEHTKLRVVAAALVEEAVRRAQARRAQPDDHDRV